MLEVKVRDGLAAKEPLEFACVKAVKGLGRLAVILFCISYTYNSLRDSLTAEAKQDFLRLGPRVKIRL